MSGYPGTPQTPPLQVHLCKLVKQGFEPSRCAGHVLAVPEQLPQGHQVCMYKGCFLLNPDDRCYQGQFVFQLSVQDHQAVLELLFLEDAQVVETKESVHDAKVLLHALLGDLPSLLELGPTLAHLVALETLFQGQAGFQGISQGQDLDMRCSPPVAIAPW